MISQNILFLWNSKGVLLRAIRSILHSNHHSTISSFLNICYLIKLLVNKSIFHEQLKRGSSKSPLLNLFVNGIALLIKGVVLAEYISSVQDNWGITKYSYSTSGDSENADNDMIKKRGIELENSNNIDN